MASKRSPRTWKYPSYWIEVFVESASRVAWADWWANTQEEMGKPLRGDITKLAPPTPEYAKVWAGMLIGHIEEANGVSIYVIASRAWKAENKGDGLAEPDEFGSDLALMALGHGVSWFDDHARFPLKVPYMEFHAG